MSRDDSKSSDVPAQDPCRFLMGNDPIDGQIRFFKSAWSRTVTAGDEMLYAVASHPITVPINDKMKTAMVNGLTGFVFDMHMGSGGRIMAAYSQNTYPTLSDPQADVDYRKCWEVIRRRLHEP